MKLAEFKVTLRYPDHYTKNDVKNFVRTQILRAGERLGFWKGRFLSQECVTVHVVDIKENQNLTI